MNASLLSKAGPLIFLFFGGGVPLALTYSLMLFEPNKSRENEGEEENLDSNPTLQEDTEKPEEREEQGLKQESASPKEPSTEDSVTSDDPSSGSGGGLPSSGSETLGEGTEVPQGDVSSNTGEHGTSQPQLGSTHGYGNGSGAIHGSKDKSVRKNINNEVNSVIGIISEF